MEFIEHTSTGGNIVEITADRVVIETEQDALDIMANAGYQYNSRKIIVHEQNLGKDFFDLSSGLAGGILQKFSNYRVRLAVVGNFTRFESKRLQEFILESNKGQQVNFVRDLSEAREALHG